MKRTIFPVLAGGAIAALALAACGHAPSASTSASSIHTSSLSSLISAAKAEGSVEVYSTFPSPTETAVDQAFEKAYGIKVNAVNIGEDDLATRFESEYQAGSASADVLVATDPTFFASAEKQGQIVPFDNSGVKPLLTGFPAKYDLTDYGVPLVQTLNTGFIYNAEKVKASQVPTTWAELAEPQWKGQVCTTLPNSSVDNAVFFDTIIATAGNTVLEDIGKNIGRTYPEVTSMNEGVAAGECEIGLNSASFFVTALNGQGSHVAFATMPSTFYPLTIAGVATRAAHPNAARLYLYFIESKAGSALINAPGSGSFGPWSADMPAAFAAATPADFATAQSNSNQLMSTLGQG